MFEIGKVYDRRQEIHGRYGGQRQGGISTPREWPVVFLFTGESGEQYGYKDGWNENGVFLYTGEGQAGDMTFVRGNRAIRDHAIEGNDLHLFQALGKGAGYRYLGRFACSSWEYRQGVDVNEDKRRTIVFHLVQHEDEDSVALLPSPMATLDRLKQRALDAASEAREKDPREARRLYHQRSAAVREYVLARAGPASRAEARPRSPGRTARPTWSPTTQGGCRTGGRITPGGLELSAPTATGRSTTGRTARRRIGSWKSTWQN